MAPFLCPEFRGRNTVLILLLQSSMMMKSTYKLSTNNRLGVGLLKLGVWFVDLPS
jgi:hypothetical protein